MTAQPRTDSRPASHSRRAAITQRPAPPRLCRAGFALPTVREVPRRPVRESAAW